MALKHNRLIIEARLRKLKNNASRNEKLIKKWKRKLRKDEMSVS